MRSLFMVLLGALLVCGCVHRRAEYPPATARGGNATNAAPKAIITPDNALAGEIVSVNNPLRIVVMRFPIGRMAGIEQRLNVYRQGVKVGEVKVTGTQLDEMIAGDIVAGDAQVGDEARSN